jgi:hypothetical protein
MNRKQPSGLPIDYENRNLPLSHNVEAKPRKKNSVKMTDEVKDVKQDTPVAPVQEQEEKAAEGAPVIAPATVDRKVYEQVRESMQKERAERKAKDLKIAELEKRLTEVETQGTDDEEEGDVRTKAKVEILYLINSDPFVKENLDLIEDKMADNPKMTAQAAIKELKSDFFDKMQKEVSQSEPEKPLKQLNPKGNTIERKDIIKDALEGKVENADPAQLEAYKAMMARLK